MQPQDTEFVIMISFLAVQVAVFKIQRVFLDHPITTACLAHHNLLASPPTEVAIMRCASNTELVKTWTDYKRVWLGRIVTVSSELCAPSAVTATC